ncbi:growth factor receptor-bound protein 10-like isoform X1 [Tachypleus tridentatus]|uniref:growth factor receptor-bound protein 10-like isoform X1 n=2 Tax=Tachypleus tridentatus TaxID=6853 RepID=UPI003FD3D03F
MNLQGSKPGFHTHGSKSNSIQRRAKKIGFMLRNCVTNFWVERDNDMLVDSGMDLAFPCLKFPTTNKKVDQCSVRQVTLEFYLEDGRHHETVVEDGLRASDLCNLLTLKFCLTRSFTWTIFEQFSDLGIERSLEDHEEVFQMYTDDCNLCSSERKFIMRQNLNKYQFLRNPENFYPLELVDLGTQMDCVTGSTVLTKMITVQNMLHSGKNMPAVQSFLWFKEPHKNSWRKYFFRLEDNVLRFSPVFDRKKPKQMYPLLDLQNSDIFLPMEGKCNKAPTKFGFCLKPKRNLGRSATVLRWFCCASEKVQECWMVALRLAKFGKKLVENYREVKSRWNFLDSSSLYQSKTQEKT